MRTGRHDKRTHSGTSMLKRFASAIAFLIATAGTATAQQAAAELVEAYQDWTVYTANTTSGLICYVASQPVDTEPTEVNRDAIYFMLTNYPLRGASNEASIIIGYPFEIDSAVTVTIDNDESFQFFTIDDGAWLRDLGREQELVVAMQRGIEMVVRGRSQRGTDTTDTYSLRGVTAALNRSAQECN